MFKRSLPLFLFLVFCLFCASAQASTLSFSARLVNADIQATGYFHISDKRLEKDIRTIENAMDKIRKLKGVEFSWVDNGESDIGFIAQEVEDLKTEVKLIKQLFLRDK